VDGQPSVVVRRHHRRRQCSQSKGEAGIHVRGEAYRPRQTVQRWPQATNGARSIFSRALKELIRAAIEYNQSRSKKKAPAQQKAARGSKAKDAKKPDVADTTSTPTKKPPERRLPISDSRKTSLTSDSAACHPASAWLRDRSSSSTSPDFDRRTRIAPTRCDARWGRSRRARMQARRSSMRRRKE
jgi:hypothetical protein